MSSVSESYTSTQFLFRIVSSVESWLSLALAFSAVLLFVLLENFQEGGRCVAFPTEGFLIAGTLCVGVSVPILHCLVGPRFVKRSLFPCLVCFVVKLIQHTF